MKPLGSVSHPVDVEPSFLLYTSDTFPRMLRILLCPENVLEPSVPTTFRVYAYPPAPLEVIVSPVILPTPPIFSSRIVLVVFVFQRNIGKSES